MILFSFPLYAFAIFFLRHSKDGPCIFLRGVLSSLLTSISSAVRSQGVKSAVFRPLVMVSFLLDMVGEDTDVAVFVCQNPPAVAVVVGDCVAVHLSESGNLFDDIRLDCSDPMTISQAEQHIRLGRSEVVEQLSAARKFVIPFQSVVVCHLAPEFKFRRFGLR